MDLQYTGTITVSDPINLKQILESGQTFLWDRKDSELYSDEKSVFEISYKTAYKQNESPIFIEVAQKDPNSIHWQSNSQVESELKRRLGLNQQVSEIRQSFADDEILSEALTTYNTLRVVNEPLYPTLISFICSTQMRIERIHEMVQNICKEAGEVISTNDTSYYVFPSVQELSTLSEQQLKDLNLGYRARYVKETVSTLNKEKSYLNLPESNSEAREKLEDLMGVGTKVADCVLLYGTDRLDVVPVDTWITKLAEEYYPDLYFSDKSKISRSMEKQFGEYAGYAQLILFRYIQDVYKED